MLYLDCHVLNCDLVIFQNGYFHVRSGHESFFLGPGRYFYYFTLIIVKPKQFKKGPVKLICRNVNTETKKHCVKFKQ
jgi:hypothetical protein